jgi:hypothetical protein
LANGCLPCPGTITVHPQQEDRPPGLAPGVFDSAEKLAERIGADNKTTGRDLEQPDGRQAGEFWPTTAEVLLDRLHFGKHGHSAEETFIC